MIARWIAEFLTLVLLLGVVWALVFMAEAMQWRPLLGFLSDAP